MSLLLPAPDPCYTIDRSHGGFSGYIDENDLSKNKYSDPLFMWTPSVSKILKSPSVFCDLMIIALDFLPCTLLHHLLCESENKSNNSYAKLLASLVLSEVPLSGCSMDPILGPSSYIYSLGSRKELNNGLQVSCVLSLFSQNIPDYRAFTFVNMLFSNITPKQVIIIGELSRPQYRPVFTDYNDIKPILRRIDNDAYTYINIKKDDTKIPYLEPSCYLQGLSAAIMQQTHVKSIPASLILSIDISPSQSTSLIDRLISFDPILRLFIENFRNFKIDITSEFSKYLSLSKLNEKYEFLNICIRSLKLFKKSNTHSTFV